MINFFMARKKNVFIFSPANPSVLYIFMPSIYSERLVNKNDKFAHGLTLIKTKHLTTKQTRTQKKNLKTKPGIRVFLWSGFIFSVHRYTVFFFFWFHIKSVDRRTDHVLWFYVILLVPCLK